MRRTVIAGVLAVGSVVFTGCADRARNERLIDSVEDLKFVDSPQDVKVV
jgi:hypothetical protein